MKGARRNSLRDVTVTFPTGVLTVVTGATGVAGVTGATGVAGSGKSTPASGEFTAAHPDAVVVDQSSVGISARSTPATYLGVVDTVRKIFARETGADAGLFSFDSAGACGTCQGRGVLCTDLAFMDPVTTTCGDCRGRPLRRRRPGHGGGAGPGPLRRPGRRPGRTAPAARPSG
ncbi:hypothetical protein GCM10010145_65450 [Streptomyces ruber]|uniref:UvrABC system protein A n=2 Tax=Streptomyces TaxID=1883 RepID=A0A918EXI2_9ACTN|nr:hypothetical protein GCM10010145_65450 [Streptomyces ruber]